MATEKHVHEKLRGLDSFAIEFLKKVWVSFNTAQVTSINKPKASIQKHKENKRKFKKQNHALAVEILPIESVNEEE